MKLAFKYVKPFAIFVALSLALLFGQAICELSLPNLMSDIVNVGIQKNGINDPAPVAISEEGLQAVKLFMREADQKQIDRYYISVPEQTTVKGQKVQTSRKVFYLSSDAPVEQLGSIYGKSLLALMNYLKTILPQETQVEGDTIAGANIEDLYAMLPMLQQLPQETISAMIAEVEDADPLLYEQIGVTFTKLFYKDIGLDLSKIQRDYIIVAGGKMLLVAFLGVVAAVSVGFISSRVGAAISRNIRRDVFAKVESFSNNEFDKFSTASLITRTTNDVQQMQMLIIMGMRIMCFAPIMGIGGIIMAVGKSVSLSWLIAVAVLVMIGLIMVIFAVAMPKFKSLQKLIDRLNLVSRENLSGMMVIRAFGNQKYEEQRFDKANADLRDTNRFVQRAISFMVPAMTIVMNFITIAIVWVGAHAIANSTLQIGDMMAFIQYAMQIIMSFLMIAVMFILVPRAAVSARRIEEVLETDLEINDKETTKALDTKECTVTFDHVSFRYHNAEHDVLHDISLVAKPGETTAIIGATGSGKSTLVNLIPRFYDVSEGKITINGVDVRDASQKQLRDIIGFVPQKGVLFSGTVDSNIKYGKEEASEEEVMQAIATAQAKDFVEEMPQQLQSAIAQGGRNVSGGQKQRLSIARALVKQAPIYIFDDSFSALDFKTDAALRKALTEQVKNATVFIVAQRVSTIMTADQIIVLDEGKIVGKGTHKELLQTCATYREIAESQLAKEELQ